MLDSLGSPKRWEAKLVDPIVTPTVIAAAAGWFGNKLLGPASDEAGKGLAKFVNERIEKIFSAAERKVLPSEVNPLPAGFLYLTVQKASFSEDSDVITNLWASLISEASKSLSHNHAIFADILTQIGSDAANFLLHLRGKSKVSLTKTPHLQEEIFQRFKQSLDWHELTEAEAELRADKLMNREVGWPVLKSSVSYPFRKKGRNPASTGTMTISSEYVFDWYIVDVLARQRLVSEFDFDFNPGWASPQMKGIYLTMLGFELLEACTKPDLTDAVSEGTL